MEYTECSCPYCGSKAEKCTDENFVYSLVVCPICGKYKYKHYPDTFAADYKDEVAFYLFHKGLHADMGELHYKYNKLDYLWLDDKSHATDGKNWFRDVSLNEIIAFNTITLHEKILLALQHIATHSHGYGVPVEYSLEKLISLLFIKRERVNNNDIIRVYKSEPQVKFLLNSIKDKGFITFTDIPKHKNEPTKITLTTSGWEYVDENTHDSSKSRSAFVAMSFSDNMRDVQKAIETAITECGFVPAVMNTIEHNHQIVPEMLYQIRQARFVIAELTEGNNGAYYEAGYALAQGKEVIHLCKKEYFENEKKALHFDVAQINTILWETPENLTEKLKKRIEATIS